jgi:hypothetical protein
VWDGIDDLREVMDDMGKGGIRDGCVDGVGEASLVRDATVAQGDLIGNLMVLIFQSLVFLHRFCGSSLHDSSMARSNHTNALEDADFILSAYAETI